MSQPYVENVLLVGVVLGSTLSSEVEDNLKELALLASSAGARVAGVLTQRKARPDPATFIGKGKAAEIAAQVEALEVSTVIFDDDLTPSQVKNLEDLLDARVMDRAWLILTIFALRARTEEARVQVALAQHQYLLPRLTKRWTHLSRQEAAIGTRGLGEKQLELDRREARKRIQKLQSDLARIETARTQTRRSHDYLPRAAITGYTNAGKSTLFNALTSSAVLEGDFLFATLDPRIARITRPTTLPLLLSDTVGFIRKLPHDLIAAFRSTLAEARTADVVLHVVDRSHPLHEEQEQVGLGVLDGLGVERERVLTVYNKADRVPELEGSSFPAISARTGQGLDALVTALEEKILPGFRKAERLIPYSESHRVDAFKKNPMTVRISQESDGLKVEYWVRA
jgi:GTP-binding protein HflX